MNVDLAVVLSDVHPPEHDRSIAAHLFGNRVEDGKGLIGLLLIVDVYEAIRSTSFNTFRT